MEGRFLSPRISFLSLITLCFFVLACNQQDDKKPGTDPFRSKLGEIVPDGEVLSGSAWESAKAVCGALYFKRTRIEDIETTSFKYNIRKEECLGLHSPATVPFRINIRTFQYEPQIRFYGDYFRDIETDDQGHLSSLCPSILSGASMEDTITNGRTRRRFEFSKVTPERHQVTIVKAKLREDNDPRDLYISEKINSLLVYVDPQGQHELNGLILEQTERLACPGLEKDSLLTAEFLEHY